MAGFAGGQGVATPVAYRICREPDVYPYKSWGDFSPPQASGQAAWREDGRLKTKKEKGRGDGLSLRPFSFRLSVAYGVTSGIFTNCRGARRWARQYPRRPR